MKTATKVRVTATLIRKGLAGDCHRCAVALAVDEAVDDADCGVVEVNWVLRLLIRSRYLVAPPEVRRFVYAIDAVERKRSGRPKLPRKLPEELTPFEFTLPPFDDPAWQEQCDGCEALFDPDELDGEGYCLECREAGSEGSET